MRHDMFKVIVERPRRGVGYFRTLHNEYRQAKQFKLDDDGDIVDEYYGTMPMRAKSLSWDYKELNENLNPLRRYLESQVGRRWNDVYSEICEHLDAGSTVKQHVRNHLSDFVEVKCYHEDGDVYPCNRRFSQWEALPIRGLYVDPNDGILKDNAVPSLSRKARRLKLQELKRKFHRKISDRLHFILVDEIWYEVHLRPTSELTREFNCKYRVTYREQVDVPHGDFDFGPFVAVKRVTASKKQIKKHNLKN